MKYTEFYIKNYKGIKELTLKLDKDPKSNVTTLVGLNESGKTTILEAISLLNFSINPNTVHRLIPKSKKSNFTDTIEIHAKIKLDDVDEKIVKSFRNQFEFREILDVDSISIKMILKFKNSNFIQEESFYPQKANVLNLERIYSFKLKAIPKGGSNSREIKGPKKQEIILELVKKVPQIVYYPNFSFDFPSKLNLDEKNDQSLEQELYRDSISDILTTIGSMNIQSHIVDRLQNNSESDQEALESVANQMGIKITEVVFGAWDELFDSRGKEIQVLPKIDNEKKSFLELKLKDGANKYQISERSLGFKWFFTFLLFTEFRKNRGNEFGELLFLLDEPASNLHSTAQKKLLKIFEELASNCKLIYATHSHHLIEPKWLASAFIVRNKALNYEKGLGDYNPNNTEIEAMRYTAFVGSHPNQQTYFQPILDALEYQPGNLEDIPNIIITEGKNDFYTFRYINEIIIDEDLEEEDKRKHKLNFYPGAGASNLEPLIALYIAWRRDFTILLDGDAEGIAKKKDYLERFGSIVENRIFTLDDIDASFNIPTEKLFSNEERVKITQYQNPERTSFHKKSFNGAIQRMLIEEHIFELEATTIARFEKVFTFIGKE